MIAPIQQGHLIRRGLWLVTPLSPTVAKRLTEVRPSQAIDLIIVDTMVRRVSSLRACFNNHSGSGFSGSLSTNPLIEDDGWSDPSVQLEARANSPWNALLKQKSGAGRHIIPPQRSRNYRESVPPAGAAPAGAGATIRVVGARCLASTAAYRHADIRNLIAVHASARLRAGQANATRVTGLHTVAEQAVVTIRVN